MSKIVAIAGTGDDAAPAPSGRVMMLWGIVLGTTIGIFVGTLLINPPRKKGQ